MSAEQRIAQLERQIKRIQIIQNSSSSNSKRIGQVERKINQTGIDEEKYQCIIDGLKQENESLRQRVDAWEKQPKAKMVLINERTDEVDEMRNENQRLKGEIVALKGEQRSLVATVDRKFAQFRGQYVPMLEQMQQRTALRSRRNNRR